MDTAVDEKVKERVEKVSAADAFFNSVPPGSLAIEKAGEEYRGCLLPWMMIKSIPLLPKFEVHEDDVWLCTFPRSGTTWTQSIMLAIREGGHPDALKMGINERFPFVELHNPEIGYTGMYDVNGLARPRFIKTHLHYDGLPDGVAEKKAKIICIARNPKDCCVSNFHFTKLVQTEINETDFGVYAKKFINGKVVYGPYWPHVHSYYQRRNDANVLFIFYEDLIHDFHATVDKLAKFIGYELTAKQLESIHHLTKASTMRKNAVINAKADNALDKSADADFIRKGTSGGWKEYFTPEILEEFDAWIEENKGEIEFRYE